VAPNTHTITRLTALWALSESGLGGLMHALKIPFTGFFLGGFAIVIITLMAQITENKVRTIIQATLLVILIKAAASPHSPPMAYIAVGFQGLIGALFFRFIPFTRFAAILFGGVALLESAVQKFLVTTLIFGQSIWEALDAFVSAVLKDLSLFYQFSFSFWLIAVYSFIYVVWGMILGNWASGLFNFLLSRKTAVLQQYYSLHANQQDLSPEIKRKGNRKIWVTFGMLAFIILVFLWQGSNHKAFYAISRTLAALALLFYVITPVVSWLMQKWVAKHKGSSSFTNLLEVLPELRSDVKPALHIAKQMHKGLFVYKAFVENLIILSLYK
jgi:hypothetical protein